MYSLCSFHVNVCPVVVTCRCPTMARVIRVSVTVCTIAHPSTLRGALRQVLNHCIDSQNFATHLTTVYLVCDVTLVEWSTLTLAAIFHFF